MRTPLRRYYDWAHAPERIGYLRFWLFLPSLILFVSALAIAFLAPAAPVALRPAISDTVEALLGLSVCWIGYVVTRLILELIRLVVRFVQAIGPDWRSGWREAWRVVRRR